MPPSSDLLKKASAKNKEKSKKKRGPKYDHPGSTRNGFGQADKIEIISLRSCPNCGGAVNLIEKAPKLVQQVAEVVTQPIEIREYQRSKHECDCCPIVIHRKVSGGARSDWGARISRSDV